jgi:zinc protease
MVSRIQFSSIVLCFIVLNSCSTQQSKHMINSSLPQDFRANAPAPGPAPVIKIANYDSFVLENGLTVILVADNKLPRISMQLLVDVPPVFQGKHTGYIDILGDMLTRGSQKRSKALLDEWVDNIGANLSSRSDGISIGGLSRNTSAMIEILSELILYPSFDPLEFEKTKQKLLSGITASKEDPNQISSNVSRRLSYKNHPYGEILSESSVEAVNLTMCKTYFDFVFRPNVSYLVIVGDIQLTDAKQMVEKHFASWEKSSVDLSRPPLPVFPSSTRVFMVDRPDAAQSVVNINYPLEFTPNSKDRMAALVMNTLLGGFFSSRINKNVREDKGYTYGARSSMNPDQYIAMFSAGGSFGTHVTDSAIHEIIYEINRMRTENITEEELKLVKATLSGNFARSLESPQTVANFALNLVRYGLSPDFYQNYLKNLELVTAEDVRKAALKYLRPSQMNITVVGNGRELKEKLIRFDSNKEVIFLDEEGNVVDKAISLAPTNILPYEILESYIKAIGGADKWGKIKTLVVESTGNMTGVRFTTTSQYAFPNYISMEMKVNNEVMQSQWITDQKVKIYQGGEDRVMTGEDALMTFRMAHLQPEFTMLANVKSLKLLESQVLNGRQVYVLEWDDQLGQPIKFYYDIKSGYRVRKESYTRIDDMMVKQMIDYDKYTDVGNGIFIPMLTKLSGDATPMALTLQVSNVIVNPVLDLSIFQF